MGDAKILVGSHTLTFPGADGGASNILGGTGGSVYTVTSLADDGSEGTLRYAVNQSGVRTIVFNVSGNIVLTKALDIANGDLTIAGQTAPEGGITIAGFPVTVKASNVILRFLRFRLGADNSAATADETHFSAEDGDALGAKDCQNIMVDHCSMSWSTDECASFSRIKNLTVQYCIISEALKKSTHVKGDHGYGGIWGGVNATYHHNLIADNDSRNPRFDHEYVAGPYRGPIDYVNNVVYNWGGNSTYGGEVKDGGTQFTINMQNNYYKAGPSSSHTGRLMELTSTCSNCNAATSVATPAKLFIDGNMVNGTAADWTAVDKDANDSRTLDDILSLSKLSEKYTNGLTLINYLETAQQAYESVISFVGASLSRDAVDSRILDQVKNNTGALINDASEVGGFPVIPSVSRPDGFDTDGDGMPDAWEDANGLDKTSKKDGSQYILSSKYTNLEVYLNELVSSTFPAGANATETR